MKILGTLSKAPPGARRGPGIATPSATRDNPPPQARQRPLWRSPSVVGSLLVLAFWFQGDAILGFTLHLLHVLIEILELGLEHLLESLFHLEGHDAQLCTAWIGLGAFMLLIFLVYRQVRRRLAEKFQSRGDFVQWTRDLALSHWPHWTPPLILLLVSVSFF